MDPERKEITFGDSALFVIEQFCTEQIDAEQAARELNFLRDQISDPENDQNFMHQVRVSINEFAAKNHLPGQSNQYAEKARHLFCQLHEAMLVRDKTFEGTRAFGVPNDNLSERAMQVLNSPGLR